VAGLGEEVEGLDVLDGVACLLELLEVAHLGGGLTGDVDACVWVEFEELVEEFCGASGTWGVDEDGCLF